MTLADHVRIIAQNWWRILLMSVLVAGAVYVLSSRQDDSYEASTFMSVTSGRADLNGVAAKDETVFLAETYAELATTRPVARQAAQLSGLEISTGTAQARLSASPASDLGFLTITASGPTARQASRLANAGAQALIDEIDEQQAEAEERDLASVRTQLEALEEQLAAIGPDAAQRASLEARQDALLQAQVDRLTLPRDGVTVVSQASTPDSPVSPRPLRDALLASLVAIVVSSEAMVGLWVLSDRFSRATSADDIQALVGLPVLGSVPRASGRAIVEAFRTVRTSLLMLPGGKESQTLAIVSANENAGKSFTAIHLSETIADSGVEVVLVDADLRRPVIHDWLGSPREPGLTDVLTDGASAQHLRWVDGRGSLRVLPSGKPVSDPAAVLAGRSFARLVDTLEGTRYTVIVDTPPIGLVSDAVPVAALCDATIFVVDLTTSRRRAVRSAIESLRRGGANLVGVVVNRTTTPRSSSYYRKTRSE
jgi:capsular exopolysaccharide synthesis family protein